MRLYYSALALGAVVVGGSFAAGGQLIFGAAYLAAAGVAGGFALLVIAPPRSARRCAGDEAGTGRARSLGRIALLAGWQLAVLGLLSVSAAGIVYAPWVLGLVLGLAAASLAAADQILSLADAPDAEGRKQPIRFLGVAGPRRLFFWVFVFPLSLPILLGDAMVFLGGPHYAPIFYPPRLALAIVSLYDIATAILVRQRYRSVQRALRGVGWAAVATIALAAMALPFGLSWWLYGPAAISVLAAGESARWLAGVQVPAAA